jgi:hypothetical protein
LGGVGVEVAVWQEFVVFAPEEVHEGGGELGGVESLFFEREAFGGFVEQDASFVALEGGVVDGGDEGFTFVAVDEDAVASFAGFGL